MRSWQETPYVGAATPAVASADFDHEAAAAAAAGPLKPSVPHNPMPLSFTATNFTSLPSLPSSLGPTPRCSRATSTPCSTAALRLWGVSALALVWRAASKSALRLVASNCRACRQLGNWAWVQPAAWLADHRPPRLLRFRYMLFIKVPPLPGPPGCRLLCGCTCRPLLVWPRAHAGKLPWSRDACMYLVSRYPGRCI